MAKGSDNIATNSGVTAPGESGASVETVFNQTTYNNETSSHMNFPQISRETKSRGEGVLEEFPCPI